MKNSATVVSIVTLVLASACGAPEDGHSSSIDVPGAEAAPGIAEEPGVEEGEAVEGEILDGDVVEGNAQALHQFEVEGTTFTYLLDADDVMLHVRTFKGAPRAHVQTATGEEPTLLEIFNALQPGAEPHAALVASHQGAAELQGRASDAVLPSALVRVENLVEKTPADLNDCKSYFLPVWGGGFQGTTPIVNTREGTAAGTTLQASGSSIAQKFMAAGACNFAAVIPRLVAFDKRVNASGPWVTQLTADIGVDDVNYIVHNPSSQVVNLRVRMIEAANNGMQMVTARKQ